MIYLDIAVPIDKKNEFIEGSHCKNFIHNESLLNLKIFKSFTMRVKLTEN
jgi:hypothetical protein